MIKKITFDIHNYQMIKMSSFVHAVPEDVLIESDLPDLMKLLFDAVDWFSLGLVLEIPHSKLHIIESDCPVAQKGRTMRLLSEVLVEWIQNHPEEATWSTLVHALSAIGMRPAARRIAHQYGMCIYGPSYNTNPGNRALG